MNLPTLYPFQVEGVQATHKFKGCVLNADDMGLGKTIQTVQYAYEVPSARPLLIVCPASLKTQWLEVTNDWYGMPTTILAGRKKIIYPSYRKKKCLIINYEILEQWMPFLLSVKPQIVAFDESHMISGINSLRTRLCTHLAKHIPKRQCLTGSPILNRPWELYPMLHICRPDIWNSPFSYGMEFCQAERDRGEYVFKGAENLQRLHYLLRKHVMIRRTKAEVLPQLPPKQRFIVPMEIDKPEEYAHAELDLIAWLGTYDMEKAQRAQRALRFVRFGYLKRLATKLKMRMALDWLDNYLKSTDRKLIIGAIHRNNWPNTIPVIEERYKGKVVSIHGGKTAAQRDVAKHQFNNDPKCRMIILQTQAGGVGLNLQGKGRDVAMIELPWAPGYVKQLIDRCHRIGTLDYVNVYFLIAAKTIERKLCELLQYKQEVSDRILEGVAVNDESLSIFDELMLSLIGAGDE